MAVSGSICSLRRNPFLNELKWCKSAGEEAGSSLLLRPAGRRRGGSASPWGWDGAVPARGS